MDDTDENIDIEVQMQPKVKLSKSKSSICHSEKDTPTTNIIQDENMAVKKPSISGYEQYSSSSFLNNWNKIIIFHDQDLRRKAFKINNNLWECELEMNI